MKPFTWLHFGISMPDYAFFFWTEILYLSLFHILYFNQKWSYIVLKSGCPPKVTETQTHCIKKNCECLSLTVSISLSISGSQWIQSPGILRVIKPWWNKRPSQGSKHTHIYAFIYTLGAVHLSHIIIPTGVFLGDGRKHRLSIDLICM